MILHMDISAAGGGGPGRFARGVRKFISIALWGAVLTAALLASALILK